MPLPRLPRRRQTTAPARCHQRQRLAPSRRLSLPGPGTHADRRHRRPDHRPRTADEEDLRGAINFLVLTDDGLRRVLAGADPFDLDIAASAPLQFDPIGNKYQAVFKASGKGPYTVIVYNSGGKIGGYTLTALNSVLLDDDSQVKVVAAAPAPLNPTHARSIYDADRNDGSACQHHQGFAHGVERQHRP